MEFRGSAIAGVNTVYTTGGGVRQGAEGGILQFADSSSAASATLNLQGGASRNASGGHLNFIDSSTAGNAIINATVEPVISGGAVIQFDDEGAAGDAVITVDGGAVRSANGGFLDFRGQSRAERAQITLRGGSANGAYGAVLGVLESGTLEDCALVMEGGSVSGAGGSFGAFSGAAAFGAGSAGNAAVSVQGGSGEGGFLSFLGDSTGGTARFTLSGNGTIDLSNHNLPGMTTGSVAGDGGIVALGSRNLTVGSNGLSTTFGGLLKDGGQFGGVGGSLGKTGAGTFTVTGANSYTGATTVSAGTLVIDNSSGSGTGLGVVQVNGGTLGGKGIIAGPVNVNSGGFLSPAHDDWMQSTLTIQSSLTFNSGSIYFYTFQVKNGQARTDRVNANGVTINSSATFAYNAVVTSALPLGLELTVISNTAATPISGRFANLADRSNFQMANNFFEAHYDGGDGNDLTLVVIPPPPIL